MKPHRLRAPSADGAVLAEPPLSRAGERLEQNASRLAGWAFDFQGRSASWLRGQARAQVLDAARTYHERYGLAIPPTGNGSGPLIVAGHQPALYHAGVWLKNFAIAALARRHQGAALNLVVDNDIPKGAVVRVPFLSPTGLRTQPVEFDEKAGELPYEDQVVYDEARFASFADRARAVLGGLVPDPILNVYWPRVLKFGAMTDRVGLRFALARRELEASWGVHHWEVPLSALCETDSFRWFLAHLLAHLPRFQELHNQALAGYRKLHGIRSTHHPVPVLGSEGDWLEAPFWVWRADQPRRRPLFVRQLARSMQLRAAGEAEPLAELPLGPEREACCAVEQLRALSERQIRLRTRALTTTLFARLLVGDLFLHGIGGAKYDELGDELVRDFYGIEPPSYLTLSMTLWLGLPDFPSADDDRLAALARQRRDLTFNPDRYLHQPLEPAWQALVLAKRRAIAAPVATHRQRVSRFEEIRRCNQALQPAVEPLRSRLGRELEQVGIEVRENNVAHNREYVFALHSEARLRAAFARVVPEAFATSELAEQIPR